MIKCSVSGEYGRSQSNTPTHLEKRSSGSEKKQARVYSHPALKSQSIKSYICVNLLGFFLHELGEIFRGVKNKLL